MKKLKRALKRVIYGIGVNMILPWALLWSLWCDRKVVRCDGGQGQS